MRKVRAVVVLLNLSLIAALVGMCIYFFNPMGEFFKERAVEVIDARDYLPQTTVKAPVDRRMREAIAMLAHLYVSKPAEPAEPKVPKLVDEILAKVKLHGVLYGEGKPKMAGMMAEVDGVARFIGVGETVYEKPQKVTLTEVGAEDGGKRYVLRFVSEDKREGIVKWEPRFQ